MVNRAIRFCLENKVVVFLVLGVVVGWGAMVAPFDWDLGGLPRRPVPVDAIPDIGENQQIVFTEWMGRSPQDVEDQITYPLTIALLGMPKIKTIRSNSFFGFSSIYVIFNEDADFYWSRTRIIEKLNSLPKDTVPEGVKPRLGPDATALDRCSGTRWREGIREAIPRADGISTNYAPFRTGRCDTRSGLRTGLRRLPP